MKKRRSRILSLLLALCLIAGLACVPAAAEEGGAPSLEISQSEFDLGTHSPSKVGTSVSYSPPRDYKFDLTNTGDTPVVIQSFEISSTADIAGDPYRHNIQLEVSARTRENRLAPGESRPMSLDAKLSVNQETTDSGEFTGTAALRVTVEAPETGETTVMEFPLTFTYEYLPAFEISQTEFDLGQISTDEFRDLQEYITGYQAFERLHGSEYVTMVNYTDSEFTNGYGGGVFTGEGNNYITPSGDYQMHVDLGLPGGLAPSLDSGEEGEVRISWELYYIGDEAKAPDTASLPTGKYTVHVEPTFRENDDSFDVIHHSIPMTFTFEIVPGTAQTEEPEDPEEEKPQYDFSVSPKELDFGELERNETVPDRTVTITNTRKTGSLTITSGQLPTENGVLRKGKLDKDMTVEEGYEAARIAALNCLAVVKSLAGSLDRVERVVKVVGFVNCTPDFEAQPKVINGASELLGQVFGDAGLHARSAVGVSSLPLGACCEVELIVRLKP